MNSTMMVTSDIDDVITTPNNETHPELASTLHNLSPFLLPTAVSLPPARTSIASKMKQSS